MYDPIKSHTAVVHTDNVVIIPEITEEEARNFLQMDGERVYYETLTGSMRVVDAVLDRATISGIEDPAIIFALIWRESNFDPNAVSDNGSSVDRGLFQLNSIVYSQFEEEMFFDVEWNIATGINHFATELHVVNGAERNALYAYNAGRDDRFDPPARTVRYANQILERAEIYREEREEFISEFIEINLPKYITSNS